MGIGLVLLIWGFVGTVLATIGAAFGGGMAALATHHSPSRLKAVFAAAVFPYVCLVWSALVFLFQAGINVELLHRDPGLGDSWTCPLPNGYAILMIDVTDEGVVYNPKTQTTPGGVSGQEDAVFDVRVLQVTPQFILGALDGESTAHLGKNSTDTDTFFILDVQSGKRTEFTSLDAFDAAAAQIGIQPKLRPIEEVYGYYRITWFDYLTLFLWLVPPFALFCILFRWVMKLRKSRQNPSTIVH